MLDVLSQQWVLGGSFFYFRKTKECLLCPVDDQSAATLKQFINDIVNSGTTIISDEWRNKNSLDFS